MLRFAIQFCDGLNHALSKGIQAHRDIKPQNCLVTQDNILKVTDFGLAKVFDDTSLDATQAASSVVGMGVHLSLTGKSAGTCTHMAPEQFADAKHVDVRADIYSFGVMLFQMVRGRLPFEGRSWEDFARLHSQAAPPPLESGQSALDTVVGKCLAKAAVVRYAGFGTLREELASIYEGMTKQPAPKPATGRELEAFELCNKGRSLDNLGRYEEALACCNRALELSPRLPTAWMGKGIALNSLGRPHEAIECLDRALALDPQMQQAWSNKAVVLEKLGRMDEALLCCDRALTVDPGFAQALYNKGSTLGKLGRHEEALMCSDRALRLNPDFAEVWCNRGNDLSALERYEEALACFDRALELNPRDALSWLNKGIAFGALGRSEDEIACYDQALTLDSGFATAWFNKGVALQQSGRINEAIDCYAHAVRSDPSYIKAWHREGVALGLLGRHSEALECFDHATVLDPYAERAWLDKGTALLHLQRLREALRCFEEAERLGHPQGASAVQFCQEKLGGRSESTKPINKVEADEYVQKGFVLAGSQRWREAITFYDRALELDAHNALGWLNKGTALAELGQHIEAIACCDAALRLNSRLADAWFNKGAILGRMGKFDEAIACYDRFIDARPRDGAAWLNKGLILFQNLRRYRDAWACFEKAQRLDVPQASKLIVLCQQMISQH